MIKQFKLKDENEIIKLEEEMFNYYSNIINEFNNAFAKYSCHLEVSKCWTTARGIPCFYERIFWICYRVLNIRSDPVVYDDENSFIERSYGVIVLKRKKRFLKGDELTVKYIEDIEDVKREIIEDLNKVKKIMT